jgi:prevent-host-death family protein
MRYISQRELRNQSGDIMRRLEHGESFVVTRDGAPIGELIPLRRRHGARLATVLEIFRSAPRIDYRRLRKDLDAVADPSPRPRA